MEREDQEVARLAQLVKNYFIPPVRLLHKNLLHPFDKNSLLKTLSSFVIPLLRILLSKNNFFTDGKPPNVWGLSEAPLGSSWRRPIGNLERKILHCEKCRVYSQGQHDVLAAKLWWADETEQK